MKLIKILAIVLLTSASVFIFASGVASFWISFQECAQGSCNLNWDAPFLLFHISGFVNDGNFALSLIGGLGLLVSGVVLGYEMRGVSQ